TPALVAPITTAIEKHLGEVANSGHTRSGEDGAGIGIDPGVAAVGGPVNLVGVVVWEAAAAFIHPGDVHVACDLVAGDLDVADESGCYLYRAVPAKPVITGVSDVDALAGIEVVPGDVH